MYIHVSLLCIHGGRFAKQPLVSLASINKVDVEFLTSFPQTISMTKNRTVSKAIGIAKESIN